mmetsp:Transcript_10201/g.38669  ORF Transcript_10201/g.38669 Transcript_10201/m.38669 type:complete len:91 (+) Transcript_10201:1078-1350(+)
MRTTGWPQYLERILKDMLGCSDLVATSQLWPSVRAQVLHFVWMRHRSLAWLWSALAGRGASEASAVCHGDLSPRREVCDGAAVFLEIVNA